MCTAQDGVQCVVNRLFLCPDVRGFVSGALRGHTRKVKSFPALRGDTQRVAAPDTLSQRPGRPWRRDLGLLCQSTRARLALLNASAAGESTPAVDLKASSLGAPAGSPAGGLKACLSFYASVAGESTS